MKQRCGAPTADGTPCQRREVFADNMRCPDHGGTGPLLRVIKREAKVTRQRDKLVRSVQTFVRQLRANGQLPPAEGSA